LSADAPSIVDPEAVSGIPVQRPEYAGDYSAADTEPTAYAPEPPLDDSGDDIPAEDGSPVMPNVIETANP
jgi:hypothetical protein